MSEGSFSMKSSNNNNNCKLGSSRLGFQQTHRHCPPGPPGPPHRYHLPSPQDRETELHHRIPVSLTCNIKINDIAWHFKVFMLKYYHSIYFTKYLYYLTRKRRRTYMYEEEKEACESTCGVDDIHTKCCNVGKADRRSLNFGQDHESE
jgi:hypothetical protein